MTISMVVVVIQVADHVVKSLLVAVRPMPALLLQPLLQCAGDIEMNPEPVSTPTLTNCLRLMQWNAN